MPFADRKSGIPHDVETPAPDIIKMFLELLKIYELINTSS